MSDVFFTADTHFGHAGIARYCSRSRGQFVLDANPLADGAVDVDAMDDAIIAEWNSIVGPHDHVYHLGDFSFRGAGPTTALIRRLRGRIHLVRGNHDRLSAGNEALFASVSDAYREIKVDGHRVVLCHYPLLTWNRAHRGAWHLHGHSHGSLRAPVTTRLDVGIDSAHTLFGALRPFSWFDVREILSKRVYGVLDHHGKGDTA